MIIFVLGLRGIFHLRKKVEKGKKKKKEEEKICVVEYGKRLFWVVLGCFKWDCQVRLGLLLCVVFAWESPKLNLKTKKSYVCVFSVGGFRVWDRCVFSHGVSRGG